VLYAHISTVLALSFPQAPRGLSAEEKRVKLLEIFHETVCLFFKSAYPILDTEQRDFFQVTFTVTLRAGPVFLMIVRQLKELEKLGPKMKGIGDCPFPRILSISPYAMRQT
jgi:hypothetical protein